MNQPNPAYINYKVQDNYPSGSTVSYLKGRFYIMGDDASEILVLNESLEEEERIQLFPKGENIRIPKATKADIEASFVTFQKDKGSILFMGSGSKTSHRDSAFLFDPLTNEIKRIDYSGFYDQMRSNLKQLNIEAATMIGENLVLGIRANTSYPDNFIVLASSDVSSPEFKRKILVKLPVEYAGISGMDYDPQHDLLFITFSSESTSNSYDDGEAGESYMAIISEAVEQLQQKKFNISSLIKLTDLSPDFRNQKMESVSLIAGQRQLLLVADDDMGGTKLFSLRF